ncbi:MAG: argininosuccinate lyase, partial [Hyphomicrobiaceae bacterium]|nr:argininosuccinate lyase [Hyphomicrobiaceae bacterium]
MTDNNANKMWGGRFAVSPSQVMEAINASVGYDQRLAPQDIRGSMAHAEMLAANGIITRQDTKAILKGLTEILAEIEAGKFTWQKSLEDVHMNVESRLRDLIG